MRFRGDPSGGRLSHAEMERKVRLERCIGGRLHLGARDGERAAIRGPSPTRERTAPDYVPVGSWRPLRPRGGAPPPIRMPFNLPPAQARPGRGGRGQVGTIRPPQPRGQPIPDPRRMPGLLQPPGPVDPMQRLALMMAVMVLGMPQVHSCHTGTRPEASWGERMSEVRICPPILLEDKMKVQMLGEWLDPDRWKQLPAVRCQASQSVLSFMCGLDGGMGKVKYERFRQPCGIRPAACWGALKSGKLKVRELEHPVAMNGTRSHMTGMEDCSRNCGSQARTLNKKITQVLMEVQLEKEWIWWNEEEGQVATASGKVAAVY
jgi:hypothetical protein